MASTLSPLHQGLLDAMQHRALHLTGDPERDLDRIEALPDSGDDALFLGFWGSTRRLLMALARDGEHAEIVLIVTKGDTWASEGLFGLRGQGIGNALLVARLLDIAIDVLPTFGVRVLTNEPVNEALAAHYEAMGFAEGTHLDMCDREALQAARGFIECVYDAKGFSPRSGP